MPARQAVQYASDVGDREPLFALDPLERIGTSPAEQVTSRQKRKTLLVEAALDRGALRDRSAWLSREELIGEEAHGARRDDVDRDTRHDVVDAERHCCERVEQAAEHAAEYPQQDADPRAPMPAAPPREPSAQRHHAF